MNVHVIGWGDEWRREAWACVCMYVCIDTLRLRMIQTWVWRCGVGHGYLMHACGFRSRSRLVLGCLVSSGMITKLQEGVELELDVVVGWGEVLGTFIPMRILHGG